MLCFHEDGSYSWESGALNVLERARSYRRETLEVKTNSNNNWCVCFEIQNKQRSFDECVFDMSVNDVCFEMCR